MVSPHKEKRRHAILVAFLISLAIFSLNRGLAYAATDTTLPSIAISSPVATGGTYNTGTATVNVSGTASDNVGVVSVYVAN
ncbi:MAG: hypothetical protein K8F29_06815, partial [Kofleriaceae bacterium]|nr:hypothetical protein [Candidatus Methylomirabilis lanthanidiphila]